MSRSLHERHKAVIPSWLTLYYEDPIALVRGEGRRVWDSDGNEYLDFFGGILTTMSGHSVPEIVDAIQEQAGKLLHTSTLYLIESQVALAEKIAELAPVADNEGNDEVKVFFGASGTEATDAALLLATAHRRSNQVLAMRNSYHGRSFGAIAITGIRGWSPSSYSPVQVSYVHGAYPYRCPFGHLDDDAYIAACTDDLRDVIATMTSGDVACLIAEPIQGVGGFATPPDGLYGSFKEVLDEYGILFVSDEVQTGWGRTGEHFWGIDAHGVKPDIITFAKGVGNGLSIGGIAARAEIMDALPANSISTFGGNPLSTAGALANITYLLEHDLQSNALKVGEHVKDRLRDVAADNAIAGDVRGKGLQLGMELVEPGSKVPHPDAATRALEECRKRGLLVGKGGLYNNVLRLAPPMSLTLDEADEGCSIIAAAIAEAARS